MAGPSEVSRVPEGSRTGRIVPAPCRTWESTQPGRKRGPGGQSLFEAPSAGRAAHEDRHRAASRAIWGAGRKEGRSRADRIAGEESAMRRRACGGFVRSSFPLIPRRRRPRLFSSMGGSLESPLEDRSRLRLAMDEPRSSKSSSCRRLGRCPAVRSWLPVESDAENRARGA